jgi:mono/diheme cytochrome c family protein
MRLVAMLVLLAGCDWSLNRMQERPPEQPVQQPEGIVAIDDVEQPPDLTRELILRGRDRFDRICAACHGTAANGDSPVARAMQLRRPPTLVDATVSKFTDQRILDVMVSGYGVMPSYAWVPARDRYAILHYVRVLQLHQGERPWRP